MPSRNYSWVSPPAVRDKLMPRAFPHSTPRSPLHFLNATFVIPRFEAFITVAFILWKHAFFFEAQKRLICLFVNHTIAAFFLYKVHLIFVFFNCFSLCRKAKPGWQLSLYRETRKEGNGVFAAGGNSRRTVSNTVSLKPFCSGLPGPDVLRPRGVCPGRVPLLCRLGWARVWEPQSLLHGPVLWTRSFPGRHGNLQLWSQLDGPRLLHRWELTLQWSQNTSRIPFHSPTLSFQHVSVEVYWFTSAVRSSQFYNHPIF